MSPFEMDLGYLPKSPLDNLHGNKEKNEKIEDFKSHLKELLKDAVYAHRIIKASQTARASLKYKPQSYKIGDKLWINKSLFKDAYAKSQTSDKLTSKKFGLFIVKRLVGKNAVEVELPSHLRIPNVVNVMHTVPFYSQPIKLAAEVSTELEPIPTNTGEEYIVEAILKHRKRGNGFQFLARMKGEPTQDAEWQPTKDFVDPDGSMNEKLYEYIKKNGILQNFWYDLEKYVVGTTAEEEVE